MKAQDITQLALTWYNEHYPKSLVLRAYNSIRPLPRSYKMQPNDNWCAAFVSAVFWTASAGNKDIFPYECGCERMVDKALLSKIWIENEEIRPRAGWVVMYDWQDKDQASDNKGWSDHTGIVTKVNEKTFEVIEGNFNNTIGRRVVKYNGLHLRGFIAPRYEVNDSSYKSTTEIAMEVIKGIWGTGKTRQERLTAAGYDYKAVQQEVNRLMKEL